MQSVRCEPDEHFILSRCLSIVTKNKRKIKGNPRFLCLASPGSDVVQLNVAIAVIFLFALGMISKWRYGLLVGFRGTLSFAAVFAVGLGIASSLGLGSAIGLFASPLTNIYPFLLLAIGIDNAFVLTYTFDMMGDSSTVVDEQLQLTMSIAGTSVTLTAITDAVAFLIGSNVSLPALRTFTIFAALGVLFTQMHTILFFCPALAYDGSRIKARRFDVLCCFYSHRTPGSSELAPISKESPQEQEFAANNGDHGEMESSGCSCQHAESRKRTNCPKDLTDMFGRFGRLLCYRWSKSVVIAAFLGLATAASVGASRQQVEASDQNFIPPGSQLLDHRQIRDDLFFVGGSPVAVYLREGTNFTSPAVWDKIERLEERLRDNDYIEASSVESYHTALVQRLQGRSPDPDTYVDQLETELFQSNRGGERFTADVKLDNGEIVAARIRARHIPLERASEKVSAMESTRDNTNQVGLIGHFRFARIAK